jgi:hypothetical protein
MRHESCGRGVATEMDFSFRRVCSRFVFFSTGTQYLVHTLPSERGTHVLPSAPSQRQPPALWRLRLGMAVARERPTRLLRRRPLRARRKNRRTRQAGRDLSGGHARDNRPDRLPFVHVAGADHRAGDGRGRHQPHRPDRHCVHDLQRALQHRAPLRDARSGQRRPRRLERGDHGGCFRKPQLWSSNRAGTQGALRPRQGIRRSRPRAVG